MIKLYKWGEELNYVSFNFPYHLNGCLFAPAPMRKMFEQNVCFFLSDCYEI